MIRGLAMSNQGPIVLLGLSQGNLERLVDENKPILVTARTLGPGVAEAGIPENMRILIFTGDTEESMVKDLRALFSEHGAEVIPFDGVEGA